MATGRGDAPGLQPGDRVVIDGADRLRDGAKISVPRRRRQRATAAPARAAGGERRPATASGGGQDGNEAADQRQTRGQQQ